MKTLIFAFILLTFKAQANKCIRTLELPAPRMDRTEALISYLNHLIDQRVIGEKEITTFRDRLQIKEITNPIASDTTSVDSSALVHYGEVQRQIENTRLDVSQLLKWSEDFLVARGSAFAVRRNTQEDTRALYREIKFLPVPGSSTGLVSQFFKWLRWRHKKSWTTVPPRTLHNFEMMDTPVTQKQWTEVMKTNPAHITQGPEKTEVMIDGESFEMLPDSPVESVTWWSAVAFANKLSEMAGLRPAYDLSDIEFRFATEAQRGNLYHYRGDLKINAPNGDIYLTEGYRLPTEAEFEHALSLAGFKDEPSRYGPKMEPYAWLGFRPVNSVASRLPLLIDGKPFYDLIGNVSEWIHDIPMRHFATWRYRRLESLSRTHRDARGGPTPENTETLWREQSFRSWDTGFRLVRTLK